MFHSAPTEKRVKVLLEQKGNHYRCKMNESNDVHKHTADSVIVRRRDGGRVRYMPADTAQRDD